MRNDPRKSDISHFMAPSGEAKISLHNPPRPRPEETHILQLEMVHFDLAEMDGDWAIYHSGEDVREFTDFFEFKKVVTRLLKEGCRLFDNNPEADYLIEINVLNRLMNTKVLNIDMNTGQSWNPMDTYFRERQRKIAMRETNPSPITLEDFLNL